MSIPTAVEEAGKRADEIWKQVYEPKPEKTGEPPEGEPAPEEKVEPDHKAPEKKVEPEPKPGEPEPAPQEDYKHKYEVLQGKYNAEVPQMAFQLAEANRKINELQKQAIEVQKPKEEPKPPEKPVENEKLKSFQQEYPDMVEPITLIAKSMIEETINKLNEKISKIDESVGKVNQNLEKSDKERFLISLDADSEIGKEWRKINEDQAFIEWLQEPDRYTGVKKHDLLMNAWNKMNTESTSNFFKDFKASKTSPPSTEGIPKETNKSQDVHPPRGAKSQGVPKEEGNPVTPEELTKFYKDVVDGKWKGKEKEASAEEERLIKSLIKFHQGK